MKNIIIGGILINLRKKNNCTKEFIANVIDVSRNSYTRIEQGKRAISYLEMKELLSFYQITFEEFAEELSDRLSEKDDNQTGQEIDIILTSLIGKMLGTYEDISEDYHLKLNKIENDSVELNKEQQVKIDYIYTLLNYKKTYNKDHLLYL